MTLLLWIGLPLWAVIGAIVLFGHEYKEPLCKEIEDYSFKQQLYVIFKCGPCAWLWAVDRYIHGKLK